VLISIHDRTLKRVAYLDNEKPDALHFFGDTFTRYLTEATSTFDFSVPKTGSTTLHFLNEKNFVSFRYKGRDYLFGIMKTEETETQLTAYTENLNLELLNETAQAFKATQAMSFEEYFNDAGNVGGASNTNLVIGINEVSNYRRTLEWTGAEDTKLARLQSIVTQFDAEMEFVTELNRDGSLNRIVLNVYKAHDAINQGVGTRRTDVTLYYGKEIESVRRTIDKTALYTAIYPTGTDGLTVSSVSETIKDSDGNTLYYTPSGSPHIYAPQSADEYPAQISSSGDKWILYRWSYDTDDVNTLYSKALAKLKSICVPSIEYEITGAQELDIGDTVTIHDSKFTPTLLLEARVSKQEISFTDPSKNTNTYSNFRALQSELSSYAVKKVENGKDAILIYIESSEGTAFKNNEISTKLTVTIYHGANVIRSKAGLTADFGANVYLQWQIKKKGDSDFTSILSTDSHLSNDGFTYTVTADDIDTQCVFNVQLIN